MSKDDMPQNEQTENGQEKMTDKMNSAQETESEAATDHEGETDLGRLGALEAEAASLKDALLRQRAETENVRRRGEKDKADASVYAVTSFARDMLNVADNLRRALDVAPAGAEGSVKTFIEGVEMTERELLSIFERFGIQQITPAAGDAFDPGQHQAMFEIPTEDLPNGSIGQVVGAGFKIKDRLLRPAMVGVAKNSKTETGIDTKA